MKSKNYHCWKSFIFITTLFLLFSSCKIWNSDKGIHSLNKIPVNREADISTVIKNERSDGEVRLEKKQKPELSNPDKKDNEFCVASNNDVENISKEDIQSDDKEKGKEIKTAKTPQKKALQEKKKENKIPYTLWIALMGGSLLAGTYALANFRNKKSTDNGCGICGIVLVILLIVLISTLIVNLL